MNDLVYVMYNLKLKTRQIRKRLVLPFDDVHSDDEWITEDGDITNVDVEDIVEEEHHENVEVGGSSSNPTLDNIEIDNLVEDVDVEQPLSSEEEEDEDGDEDGDDEDGDGDVGGLDF